MLESRSSSSCPSGLLSHSAVLLSAYVFRVCVSGRGARVCVSACERVREQAVSKQWMGSVEQD